MRLPTLLERATFSEGDLDALETMALRLARHAHQPLRDVWSWPIDLLIRQHALLVELVSQEHDFA